MATSSETEQVYSGNDSAGVAVLIGCSTLSLVSVLGVYGVLGVSAVCSRHSSDKTLFVRTHTATYFISLLMCNLAQAIGGLLNIPWIVADRVYSGVTCTAQGAIKQFGNVGTAIFCLVIAIHTFCQLFFRRQWSNRTSYIVLIVSWTLLLLEVCIEAFVIANPEVGPYFGIAGYWCWITPAYPIPRYATSYLLMLISAGLSFILYLLVFFRLRGNITISAEHKISFHRRPKVRLGRTGNGTYIVTDDQRVESHLTRVAKHMLWYPVVFTVVILPMASTRFSTFHGASVPFSVTIGSAGLFMLHGFINTVLFCTTRNILPGSWRRRLGLGTALDSGRSDFHFSSRIATWRFTGLDARIGAEPVILSVGVEKDVEIMYDEVQPSPRCVKPRSSLLLTLNPLPRVRDSGEQWADTHKYHIQQPPLPPRIEMDRVEATPGVGREWNER